MMHPFRTFAFQKRWSTLPGRSAWGLKEPAMGDEIHNRCQNEYDEPDGPGMKLTPMRVVINGQQREDKQVQRGHGHPPIDCICGRKYASYVAPAHFPCRCSVRLQRA